MSKRLNKRQQREQEELAQLQAGSGVDPQEPEAQNGAKDEDEEQAQQEQSVPVNLFSALNDGDDNDDEESEEEDDVEVEQKISTPSSKKKKNKKKKKKPAAALAVDDDDDDENEEDQARTLTSKKLKPKTKKASASSKLDDSMDELDRAIAELKLKNKDEPESSKSAAKSFGFSTVAASHSLRALLSVDPKNLDADAELRKFFGAKVVAATSSGLNAAQARRQAQLSKLRTTLAKPKLTWPPATSLNGLGMREVRNDDGVRVFTFEHSGAWRDAQRQFIGATRSHDPNQLFALLQVFPWHVDTLLQMSEVYRLQSDIGAASDYAERALFAFDRCLIPAFNITSGACRLDFKRVENRPMFTALHRNIAYLGRRGCWLTAFTFAKLLFALDPHGDPHAAVLWLDFLAIKTGNGKWLLDLLEADDLGRVLSFYPGLAYAQALAIREQDAEKGDQTLFAAIVDFPEIVPVLADKIGATISPAVRAHPRFRIQAGYEENPETTLHLLSHLYVSRSEVLWKENGRAKWLSEQVERAFTSTDMTKGRSSVRRDRALSHWEAKSSHDAMRENICRHVLVTESTSYLGFLPPSITQKQIVSYDPLPPHDGVSFYTRAYFAGEQPAETRLKPERLQEIIHKWQMELEPMVMEALAAHHNPDPEDQVDKLTAIMGPCMSGLLQDVKAAGATEHEQHFALQSLVEFFGEMPHFESNVPTGAALALAQEREEDDDEDEDQHVPGTFPL